VIGFCKLAILDMRLLIAIALAVVTLVALAISEHAQKLAPSRVSRFEGRTRPVRSLAFVLDGSLLATAGNDGMLGHWTVATGRRRVTVDSQRFNVRIVAFSPDVQTLVVATLDDDVRLCDLADLLRAQSASNASVM
jgi:WD40 repeat protein